MSRRLEQAKDWIVANLIREVRKNRIETHGAKNEEYTPLMAKSKYGASEMKPDDNQLDFNQISP